MPLKGSSLISVTKFSASDFLVKLGTSTSLFISTELFEDFSFNLEDFEGSEFMLLILCMFTYKVSTNLPSTC